MTEFYVLFWPTVGPILSGVRPGVSLYIVLIFSNNVWHGTVSDDSLSSGRRTYRFAGTI